MQAEAVEFSKYQTCVRHFSTEAAGALWSLVSKKTFLKVAKTHKNNQYNMVDDHSRYWRCKHVQRVFKELHKTCSLVKGRTKVHLGSRGMSS